MIITIVDGLTNRTYLHAFTFYYPVACIMSGGTEWKKKLYYSKEPGCDYHMPQDLLIGTETFYKNRPPVLSRDARAAVLLSSSLYIF